VRNENRFVLGPFIVEDGSVQDSGRYRSSPAGLTEPIREDGRSTADRHVIVHGKLCSTIYRREQPGLIVNSLTD